MEKKYCRRGSRVGVARPPLEFSKIALRETTLHYKILGIIGGGGGSPSLPIISQHKIYRHYQYIAYMSVTRSVKVLLYTCIFL